MLSNFVVKYILNFIVKHSKSIGFQSVLIARLRLVCSNWNRSIVAHLAYEISLESKKDLEKFDRLYSRYPLVDCRLDVKLEDWISEINPQIRSHVIRLDMHSVEGISLESFENLRLIRLSREMSLPISASLPRDLEIDYFTNSEGLGDLKASLECPSVTSLYMNRLDLQDSRLELAGVENETLRELTISDFAISSEDLLVLTKATKNLATLVLHNIELMQNYSFHENTYYKMLFQFITFSFSKHLKLLLITLNEENIYQILDIITSDGNFPVLEKLLVNGIDLQRAFKDYQPKRLLKSNRIKSISFPLKTLELFHTKEQLPSLKKIKLMSHHPMEGIPPLVDLFRWSQLKSIMLSISITLPKESIQVLINENSTLKSLTAGIDSKSLAQLLSIKHPSLTQLKTSMPEFSSDILEAIATNQNLKILEIDTLSPQINLNYLEIVSDILKRNQTLTTLNLYKQYTFGPNHDYQSLTESLKCNSQILNLNIHRDPQFSKVFEYFNINKVDKN